LKGSHGVFATVEAEDEFVKVAPQILWINAVMRERTSLTIARRSRCNRMDRWVRWRIVAAETHAKFGETSGGACFQIVIIFNLHQMHKHMTEIKCVLYNLFTFNMLMIQ